MSKVVIKDFLLSLGFDGKDVHKGLDGIEKRLDSIGKKKSKHQKEETKASKANQKARIREQASSRKYIREQRRLKAMHKMELETTKLAAARMKTQLLAYKAQKQQLRSQATPRKSGGGGYRGGGNLLRNASMLAGSFYTLHSVVSGLTGSIMQAMQQQMAAERAAVGL